MEIINIPTELIDEDTDQPRYLFNEDSLQELMNSIGELGLLSPIKVRSSQDGRYKIVYGNRRYKACKMLELQTIPCIISNITDELEIYLEQIAENLAREGFSPIEEAEAFNKLLNDPKFRSSTKFLSSKLGKSEAYIKNKCDLLKFSSAVKKLVVHGKEIKKDRLTEEQLIPIKDLPVEYRDSLALIAAKDELPVSDVKKIARLFKDPDLSDGTKSKLLFKSGPELLETWSTREHNKAQTAKPSQVKAEEKKKPKKDSTDATKVTPIEGRLQRLLAAIPKHASLDPEMIQTNLEINASEKETFLKEVDILIETLEKHLLEWKQVRELATLRANID